MRAVTGFVLACAAARPLAILLDDLHWADGASLDLMRHLAHHTRAQRVLLLGTYRDVEVGRQRPLERVLRDLHRSGVMERLVVRRLDPEGTAALIAAVLGEADVSPDLVQLVHEHTDGNPFFTQEVVRTLVERGDVYRADGRWARRDITQIEVPESVRSAIGERLSRLREGTQDLLHTASVLGQTFGFDELRAMGDHAEADVEAALEEAMTAGLIREMDLETYGFNHALIQQALYGELSGRRKRRLHAAAGEALERIPARLLMGRAAEVAWHFLEGDDSQRAQHYALLAFDEAWAVSAWGEAEQHARNAVELARETGNRNLEVEALWKHVLVLYDSGRFDEFVDLVEEAIAVSESTNDRVKLLSFLDALARGYIDRGELRRSRAIMERSIRLAEELDDRKSIASAISGLGAVFLHLGEWALARDHLQRALDVSRDAAGDWMYDWRWIRIDLAKLCLFEGKWQEGARHLADCLNPSQADASLDPFDVMSRLYARWLRARLDLLLGNPDAAFSQIADARDDFRLGRINMAEVQPTLAEVYLALGDSARAGEVAANATTQARDVGHRLALVDALTVHGLVLARQSRWAEAARGLEEAVSLARTLPYPYGEARALYELGLMEAENRDPGSARARLEQALGVFERLAARPYCERARAALSRLR